MKYLSIDLEATGLGKDDLMIEFALVPIDASKQQIATELAFHHYVRCPSYEELAPKLDEWVKNNNKNLIELAHIKGLPLDQFKSALTEYIDSSKVQQFFKDTPGKKIILGKSLNAIDLPFLNRDLGWDYMRTYFHHQVVDVSSLARFCVDAGVIPDTACSGSGLLKYLKLGDVAHTALEDAVVTAKAYFGLMQAIKNKSIKN